MKIKRIISILLCFVLLFMTACRNNDELLYKEFTESPENALKNRSSDTPTEDGEEADPAKENAELEVHNDITGELTIYCHKPSVFSGFDSWFSYFFSREYPNVKVNFIGPKNNIGTEYTEIASVALMSGTAGDIIDISGLPYFQYAQNNLLEDLYPFMDNDPSFQKEDYYTNIFEAFEYKDGLYGIPLGFFYWCYRFNKPLLDDNNIDISRFDSMNYKDVTDIYYQLSKKKTDLFLSKSWNYWVFENFEPVSYFDEKKDTANFNSKEFIDYLNVMNSITWPEEFTGINQDTQVSLDDDELCGYYVSDCVHSGNARAFTSINSKLTDLIPVAASNGDKPFQTAYPLAITASSNNKDLAWLFLNSWLKEKNISDMDEIKLDNRYLIDGYSINRKNTRKLLEKAFGPGHDKEIARIDAWNSERNRTNMGSDKLDLYDAYSEICAEFYAGRISAEECAKQIQERMEIYLKE